MVFAQSLDALRQGGQAPLTLNPTGPRQTLPPPTPAVAAQLDRVAGLWAGYEAEIRRLASPGEGKKAEAMLTASDAVNTAMNGYSSHTYKWYNAAGEYFWVKYHFKTNQGIRNLTRQQADALAGTDPDHATRDLSAAIDAGDFPSWTLEMQIMSRPRVWLRRTSCP